MITNLFRIKKINIFNYFSKDFENFDLEKLQTKFKLTYKKYGEDKFVAFQYLSNDIENLEKSIYKLLQREYDDLIKNLNKKYFGIFGHKNFKKIIKNLEKKQEEYKLKFLNILFELNEINLDYEIKDNLLILIKNYYGEVKSIINNSEYYNEIILTDINVEISNIENEIEILEKIVISEKNIDIFEKKSKKLLKKIEELYVQIICYIRAVDFLKVIIPQYDLEIKKIQNDLDKNFNFIWESWKKDIDLIKKDIVSINKIIVEDVSLKTLQKIYKKISNIIEQILSIILESKKIKSYDLFLNNNSDNFSLLIKGIEKEYDKSVSDINKYFFENKETKAKNLNNIFSKIENLYKNFLEKKQNDYQNIFSKEIYFDFLTILDLTKEFFSELNKIILDIKLVIEQKNNINKILYQMNNSLLKSEIKMNYLPEKIKFVKEQEFQKFQSKVSDFIEKYKDNFFIIANEENTSLKYENTNIKLFYNEINSITYLYQYIENLIVILNKYRENKKIDKLIDLVENNYIQGNLSESLRMANKIIELYKIYE
ncbi:MAG: hypothetical protein HPAVJP_4610 [Candidatus Hepatoplasma vulgare]|nr:MAG: hypothetical protein HPAVJP_4610 [Candidatus Hepatoplasma sp.]